MATKIVIEVNGGVVQEVYCDDPSIVVIVVDWDTEGCEPGRHVYIVEDSNGVEQLAHAAKVSATPMGLLPLETSSAVELAQA